MISLVIVSRSLPELVPPYFCTTHVLSNSFIGGSLNRDAAAGEMSEEVGLVTDANNNSEGTSTETMSFYALIPLVSCVLARDGLHQD